MADKKSTPATEQEPSAVVDIITSEPGAREVIRADFSKLPENYRDESWIEALANASSLSELGPEFLAALTQLHGSNLISKEDLVGQGFAVLEYAKTVGKFRHRVSREYLTYYTLKVLTEHLGRGTVVLSGTGMAPVFDTMEAAGQYPPYYVPKGLRRSDDWTNDDGEPMNGTWYLG